MRTKIIIILIFYCILFFIFDFQPRKFVKKKGTHYYCHGNFHKNSGNALFKLRRHEVANMYEDKYQYQYFGY